MTTQNLTYEVSVLKSTPFTFTNGVYEITKLIAEAKEQSEQ